MFATIMLLAALTGAAQDHAPAAAEPQEHGAPAAEPGAAAGEHGAEGEEHGFDILHHIQDSDVIELPFGNAIHLPPAGSWMVGPIESALHPGRGYGSPAWLRTLDEARAMGATWVSLTVFGRVWDLGSAGLDPTSPICTSPEAMARITSPPPPNLRQLIL